MNVCIIIIINIIIFIYFEREREGGAEMNGRERIPSRLRTVSTEPDEGLNLTNCEIVT